MKRVIVAILAVGWALFVWPQAGHCACIEDKDLELLINDLEHNVSGQEQSIAALKVRYELILKQKEQVLDLIEQDKQQFKEKIRNRQITEKELSDGEVEKKALEEQLADRKQEQARLSAERKERELKKKEEEKEKDLQAKEKKQLQAKALTEQKERFYAAERERQIDLAFEKARNWQENKEVNYLDQLIKKQRELCSTIISLQLEISDEKKNLKHLKESRKFLANQNKL